MSAKVTMGKLIETWESAFIAGWNAHAFTPWVEPSEAFEEWVKELDRILTQSEDRF